jgi:hypothetical protein
MGEALQDYNLASILKKRWIVAKNCLKKQKIENLSNEGKEQVENKKTTINNKTMQTEQHMI